MINVQIPELNPYEHYAGVVLFDGALCHHLILLPGKRADITWDAAAEWAAEINGELPTLNEQRLLHANLKSQFNPKWYWSCEQYAHDFSEAWGQGFDYGHQDHYPKNWKVHARAVRRVVIGNTP